MLSEKQMTFLIDHLIWIILILVFSYFAFQSEHFLTERNISNILTAAAVLGVLVVGQSFVLISGNFDLSTESTLGLSALMGLWLIVPAGAPTFGWGRVPESLSFHMHGPRNGRCNRIRDRLFGHDRPDAQFYRYPGSASYPSGPHACLCRRSTCQRIQQS